MWYFMAFLGGYGLGILLAAILTAAKRADEWSEAYHKGVEVGKGLVKRGEGYWMVGRFDSLGNPVYICSDCRTEIKWRTDDGTIVPLDPRKMNYCANCGAKMSKAKRRD